FALVRRRGTNNAAKKCAPDPRTAVSIVPMKSADDRRCESLSGGSHQPTRMRPVGVCDRDIDEIDRGSHRLFEAVRSNHAAKVGRLTWDLDISASPAKN